VKRIRVAHFINPYLQITQNWIYNHIINTFGCDHLVLCRTLENIDQFPFESIHAAYPKDTLQARIAMLIARVFAQYPVSSYLKVIERENPAVFHGHFSWESWRNIKLVKRTGIPLVTTFYGMDINKLPRRWVWRHRYPQLFSIGDAFIVEGYHMAQCLESMGCPKNKIHVVHLGVDIDRIEHLDDAQRKDATVRILFIGLGREKKGAEYAAKAFGLVAQYDKNMELHIIGDGPYRNRVESIVTKIGVKDQVVFHGFVAVEKYLSLMGSMDICLAPSVTASDGDTEGGAPVSVIEAQVAGIPVVGTYHCDIPGIVRHSHTGLLCAERDSESLAHHLKSLVENKRLRQQLGNAAKKHATAQHDIRLQGRKLYEIYRMVVEKGHIKGD